METTPRSFPLLLAVPAALLLGCWGCSAPGGDLGERYRDLEVPRARLESPDARVRGRDLYLQHCALCHGEGADGHGARRQNLSGPPADFTSPVWRESVTPRQVYQVIREGARGTSMPAWKILDQDATWDLVAYLLSVSEQGAEPLSR